VSHADAVSTVSSTTTVPAEGATVPDGSLGIGSLRRSSAP
jgi:hypothetical protein